MLIEKLAAGVVQVKTPIGPRYVMPSFSQRLYLVWMFRNFPILPHAVLSGRQQRMIIAQSYECAVAARQQLPVDAPRIIALRIWAILGELGGRPTSARAMHPMRRRWNPALGGPADAADQIQ